VTEVAINGVNSSLKNLVNGTNSLVPPCLNDDFDKITTSRTAIHISVSFIYRYTIDSPFDLAKLNVKFCKSACLGIKFPKLYCIVVNSNKLVRIFVEELDVGALLIVLVSCELDCLRLAFVHVPAGYLIDVRQTAE